MFKIRHRLFFISIITFYFLINCSTPHTDEEKRNDVIVDDIRINEVENKVPVENSEQIDLELLAILNNENNKQRVDYNWYVEYLKLDIEGKTSISNGLNIDQT